MTTWPAAVLFDMDGTLVDSHENVERAWITWAQQHGIDAAALLTQAHGLPAEVTVARWLPDASEEEIATAAAEQLALQYEDITGIVPAAGALELLEFLTETGFPWAVHTSADDRLARARLEAAGIDPPVLVTRDQLQRGKPAPDGYLRAAELLDIEPSECVVVEDTEVGIESGRAAGMQTIGVRGVAGDLPLGSLPELHLWLAVATAPSGSDALGSAFPFPFPMA